MSTDDIIERAEKVLARWSSSCRRTQPNWLDVVLDRTELVDAAAALTGDSWGYLASISAVDLGTESGAIEVLYHFCEGPVITNLRVRVGYDDPAVPTLTTLLPAALLFEQEAREMVGVQFVGMPYEGYLFLPDEWPAGVFPLRKAFHGLDDVPSTAGGMEA